MTSTDYSCFVSLWIVPIAFAVFWIRMRLGLDKRWFVSPTPSFISSGFYFALPTFVLGTVVGLISGLLVALDPYNAKVLFLQFAALGLIGSGFMFAYFEPGWMSPAWYRWLKTEHGDIMPYLVHDAHRLGRKAWMERVKTQEGLEEWATEVRRKHGL
jgi:hypothetical protein